MILNEKELEVCLKYALQPLLKQYDMSIKESYLRIEDKIYVRAVILYQNHTIDLKASFVLDYQNQYLCFKDIDGKIEYVFLQMNLINAMQQMIHFPQVKFESNHCYIQYDLPIQSIHLNKGKIVIQMIE